MNGLEAFTETFFGYGNLAAPIWFIGLEEGGGKDLAEIEQRLRTWERRGASTTEDLAGFHRDIGVTRFFDGPRPALQKTWSALMKALQAYRQRPADTDTLRQLQASEFGAKNGLAALLELLPLPSKDKSSWIYSSFSASIPMLASRAKYEATMRPQRIATLRALIAEYRPRAVICYGMSELRAWESLIDARFSEQRLGKHRCLLNFGASTLSAVVPHPGNARSSEFWQMLGATLRGTE
jgi:hypothetical protein